MIGPLKLRDFRLPQTKFEAQCHRCNWAFFVWTEEEGKIIILEHPKSEHRRSPLHIMIEIDD